MIPGSRASLPLLSTAPPRWLLSPPLPGGWAPASALACSKGPGTHYPKAPLTRRVPWTEPRPRTSSQGPRQGRDGPAQTGGQDGLSLTCSAQPEGLCVLSRPQDHRCLRVRVCNQSRAWPLNPPPREGSRPQPRRLPRGTRCAQLSPATPPPSRALGEPVGAAQTHPSCSDHGLYAAC